MKPPFYQFVDPKLIPVLILWGENSFTKASTSSWLLKHHEYKKWVIDPRELGLDYMLNEATFLPVCWSQAHTSSYPWGEELLHWSFHLLLVAEVSWIQEVSYRSEGTRSTRYAEWSHLFTSLLIPSWYQFLSFEVKNSFTEASTSSWCAEVSWIQEVSYRSKGTRSTRYAEWSHLFTSLLILSIPVLILWGEETPSPKLPPPLGC